MNMASPSKEEVLSDALPLTLGGQYHSSLWESAVFQAFVKFEDQRATPLHPFPHEEIHFDDNHTSRTFARLARTIAKVLEEKFPPTDCQHSIPFTAQNSAQENVERRRCRIPLFQITAQWVSFCQIPSKILKGKAQSSAQEERKFEGSNSSEASSAGSDMASRPIQCRAGLNKTQAADSVRDLCERYMNSFPGPNNLGTNTSLHSFIKSLLSGKSLSDADTQFVYRHVRYRMDKMRLASEFKDALGVDFADCDQFDVYSWEGKFQVDETGKPLPTKHPKLEFTDDMLRSMGSCNVFPTPPDSIELSYTKPNRYLAAVLAETTADTAEGERLLRILAAGTARRIEGLNASIRNERSVRQIARTTFNSYGKRLRSPSPRKRGPMPPFEEATAIQEF